MARGDNINSADAPSTDEIHRLGEVRFDVQKVDGVVVDSEGQLTRPAFVQSIGIHRAERVTL